ncbi:methionyl-tRNA formyltransferase [Arthrobacter roseus]|uniref:methionyl-tRNA formyltransferase n=1 Tax=Arthrobacter roseus TaxID=136274 RepID=UPI0019628BC5|nr:methionyl-tRNA formyltransferase [Arthrobacter roseus]MBM7848412.1 methionyl-tRNA formyltransferase [Arthrobacter roseus]
MRVLFAGTPEVAVPSLDALVAAGFHVVAVLTRPDAPLGRKRVMTPSPVAVRAAELNIPIIKASQVDEAVQATIQDAMPDVAAVVAFGALVPESALRIPLHGWVNLHFSLLPSWRGASPVQYALINGDDITGASTFLIDAGLDTGPILGAMTESVKASDTAGELLTRLSHSGAVLLVQTVAAIDKGLANPVPQVGDATLAPKLSIDDARVNWKQPAISIRRRINGVTPEPGAWTTVEGQRLKFGPVELSEAPNALLPGQAARSEAGLVIVGTGSGAVSLRQVQPAGKKMMSGADWFRGASHGKEVVFE